MKRKRYTISNNEKTHLQNLGFHHIGDGIYVHEFAGYKWHGYTTITCKFTAYDDSHEILIDVYTESGNFYSPYYIENQNNKVLEIINSNIEKEKLRCGIS